jgi:hypothetical protein
MRPRVEVVEVRGLAGPADAEVLRERIGAAFAAGADWVAVDVAAGDGIDPAALAGAAGLAGVVVCGGSDALRRELAAAGVVATRRLLDVEVAARATHGDGLKRRLELLELPRPRGGP